VIEVVAAADKAAAKKGQRQEGSRQGLISHECMIATPPPRFSDGRGFVFVDNAACLFTAPN
jgi:hypothetical protein